MTQNKYNRKYLRELYKNNNEDYLYDDARYGMDEEIEKYGFSMLETWNLDTSMVEVLYERLKRFLEQDMVNLEFHQEWEGELNGLTQLEIINLLISLCEDYLLSDNFMSGRESQKKYKKIWEVWTVLAPAMWW